MMTRLAQDALIGFAVMAGLLLVWLAFACVATQVGWVAFLIHKATPARKSEAREILEAVAREKGWDYVDLHKYSILLEYARATGKLKDQ